jgi:hypothetical protein
MNGVVHSMKSFSHQKIGTRFIVFDNLVKLFLFLGVRILCVRVFFAWRSNKVVLAFWFSTWKRISVSRGDKRSVLEFICSCKKKGTIFKNFESLFFSVILLLISRSSSWSVEVEISFPFVFLVFRCWFLKRKKLCWS